MGKGCHKLVIVAWILFSGCFPSPGSAETFRSAVSQEHANGIVAHIINKVSEKLDITLEMRLAPFARRLSWMESGAIDIMGGLLLRPEREAYIYFVSPPYVQENRKVFYVRKGDEDRINEYEDLYGLIIGTKIQSTYFPRFDQDQRLNKEAVGNVNQNFKKLLANHIDAVIYSDRSGYAKLMEMGITDQVGMAHYAYAEDNPVYIGISRRSPLMVDKARIEAIVRRMVESGEMDLIIHNHYSYLPESLHYPKPSEPAHSEP